MTRTYAHAILGGTFDHFHMGHRQLLDAAFENAEHIVLGLSDHSMYKHKFLSEVIESYEVREAMLQRYFQEKKYSDQGRIIRLTDIYGESLIEKDIDAIFVTDVTYPNALIINQEREKRGFGPLVIEKVPFVKGSDGEIITSERIRRGEIDRRGNPYAELFDADLALPDELREELKKPIGTIVPDVAALHLSNYHMVITVGDIVTASVKDAGHVPAISIIDLKTRRHAVEHANVGLTDAKQVTNPAGKIEPQAVQMYKDTLQEWLSHHKHKTIVIDGEEDLLALPAILLAPLGSVVLYGQYEMGIVVNEVTEEMKEKVVGLVRKF